jgi:hypothetical protein
MLSPSEREARHDFYTKIFGHDRVKDSTIFTDHWWPISAYREKIAGLSARGFTDPQKMIASLPAILSLSFKNIDEKIAGLSARGFTDPQKMIASLPAILSLSFGNIDRKLRLCKRLAVDVDSFIAYTIVFIGLSPKHYVPIARRLRRDNKDATPKNVFAVYKAKTF